MHRLSMPQHGMSFPQASWREHTSTTDSCLLVDLSLHQAWRWNACRTGQGLQVLAAAAGIQGWVSSAWSCFGSGCCNATETDGCEAPLSTTLLVCRVSVSLICCTSLLSNSSGCAQGICDCWQHMQPYVRSLGETQHWTLVAGQAAMPGKGVGQGAGL